MLFNIIDSLAQYDLDIVDPYEMKVSRSKEADTFYFTQNAVSINAQKTFDTLRSYDVFLEERITPFGIAYMCNGAEVTKTRYLEFKKYWNASVDCKPCLLYTYNSKDQIKHIAFQYEDCLCGTYKEFYPEGGVKVEGQFLENPTENWISMRNRGLCNRRSGIWTYYLPNGAFEKSEEYKNGILQNTILPQTSTLNTTSNSNTAEENQIPAKKGIIHKLKDRNSVGE